MSDHERGAYTPPTDAPLAFDAREPVRGARPMPVTLIISILVLAGLATAIFLFYRSGVRQAGQPPQAVGTPVAGMKSPPSSEAQPQDPAAGLQIYKTEGGKAAPSDAITPKFAPPPEQPQVRAAPTTPVVVTQAPPAAQAAAQPVLRPAIPLQPPAAATPPTAVPPPPKPVVVAKAEPPPVKAEAKPAPAKPEPVKAAPAKAEAAKSAKAEAKPEKAAAPAPAAKSSGGVVAQIGAVSSQALADKAWNDAAAAAPGLAAGKGKTVEKVEVGDGKILYRVQLTGFADRAAATAFCDKLKAAGKACFVK